MSRPSLVAPESGNYRVFENATVTGVGASERASPECVSMMAPFEKLNYIGMRHPVLENVNSRSNAIWTKFYD